MTSPGTKLSSSRDAKLERITRSPGSLTASRSVPSSNPARIREIEFGSRGDARHQAGIDGVEVVASHGYLPAQFINPRVNRRTDGYNGELDQRLRFLREVIGQCNRSAWFLRLRITRHSVFPRYQQVV